MSEPRGRRSGGRAGRAAARAGAKPTRDAFVTRSIEPREVIGEDDLATIEANADRILEEAGLDFTEHPRSLELFAEAGASVDGERVRFPAGMCREIIQASAPSQFVQHARNPENNVTIGGNNTVFVPNYGSPFVTDLDKGRRYGTIEDFENIVKLAYMLPQIHHSGGTVCEPVDVPINKRHLDMVYAHMRYSDKPFMGSVTARERAVDTVEMAKILFGEDFVAENCVITSLINANSPKAWDGTMLDAAEVYASNGQACMISPFILAGAMAPVTVAGVAAQTLAEALAGLAFCQLVRPGAPVIFGSFASSMSMQTGAPTFGTPEPALVMHVVAALARRLGVPFRSGGSLCASKVPDAQAAYESANTLQAAMSSGVNFMLHAAGWIEGGLSFSFEKFIMDADQLAMAAKQAKGVDMSENGQAMEPLIENAPSEHYLGTAHTLANFETAFINSSVADNNSFEQWEEDGRLDEPQRANLIWKQMLADYVAPDLDPLKDQELQAYIAKRKAEMPDGIG